MKNKKMAPDIRFKGFSNDWEEKKLGEFIEIKSGDSPTLLLDENGTIPYFKVEELNNSLKYQKLTPYKIKYDPKKIMKKNSIIFPKRGAAIMLNKIRILAQDSYADTNIMALYTDKYNLEFLYYYILLTGLSSIADTTSIPQINNKHIVKLKYFFTELEEQEKIGNFFTKLDNVIELCEDELENYKEYKKSMLQKMFPKKDKKIPEIRFAGYDGDWGKKKLGDISTINRGLTYRPNNVKKFGVRVLRSSNIDEDKFRIYENDVFVEKEAVKIPFIEDGDILVTAANGSSRLVGKRAIVENISEEMVHGGFMLTIKSNSNYFINSWMGTSSYKRVLKLVEGGNGAIGNLSKVTLENAIILVPTLPEQEKIGSFFSNLDSIIEKQEEQLEIYKNLKKSMLQKMFV